MGLHVLHLFSENEESTPSPNDAQTAKTITTNSIATYILSGFISLMFLLLLTALSIILWHTVKQRCIKKSTTKRHASGQNIEYEGGHIYETVYLDTMEAHVVASDFHERVTTITMQETFTNAVIPEGMEIVKNLAYGHHLAPSSPTTSNNDYHTITENHYDTCSLAAQEVVLDNENSTNNYDDCSSQPF